MRPAGRFVLDFTERLFFDRSGTLVRIVAAVSGTDTFINSDTGKELPTTTFHNAVIIDAETALDATNGVTLRATVPGSGAVLLDVERIVSNKNFSVVNFQAGPHQFFDGYLAGLCAAQDCLTPLLRPGPEPRTTGARSDARVRGAS
jgi:hypothetical protein